LLDRDNSVPLVILIMLFGCIFGVIMWSGSLANPMNQPMPSIWLHEARLEDNNSNVLSVALSSNVYDDIKVEKIIMFDSQSNQNIISYFTQNEEKYRGHTIILASIDSTIEISNSTEYHIACLTNHGVYSWDVYLPFQYGYLL
jgi:hypothetical protein